MKIPAWLNPRNWFRKPAAPTVRIAPQAWEGDGTWPFIAVADGDDVILRSRPGAQMFATWFGGADDPMDNGETRSGINTKDNPTVLGCALPMNIISACNGSPIPLLPMHIPVSVVTASGASITVPLIDIGPNRRTGNTVDLTQTAFRKFAPLRTGKFTVASVRIHGGARHFRR